jgi:hypothetical protein
MIDLRCSRCGSPYACYRTRTTSGSGLRQRFQLQSTFTFKFARVLCVYAQSCPKRIGRVKILSLGLRDDGHPLQETSHWHLICTAYVIALPQTRNSKLQNPKLRFSDLANGMPTSTFHGKG